MPQSLPLAYSIHLKDEVPALVKDVIEYFKNDTQIAHEYFQVIFEGKDPANPPINNIYQQVNTMLTNPNFLKIGALKDEEFIEFKATLRTTISYELKKPDMKLKLKKDFDEKINLLTGERNQAQQQVEQLQAKIRQLENVISDQESKISTLHDQCDAQARELEDLKSEQPNLEGIVSIAKKHVPFKDEKKKQLDDPQTSLSRNGAKRHYHISKTGPHQISGLLQVRSAFYHPVTSASQGNKAFPSTNVTQTLRNLGGSK
ncbi:MAG: hypothetical protein H0U71_08110 [Gammaproteobacteria bacterium]|nr:hypothetical protein [Gammaproteobacteria bacterium]